MHTLRIFPLVYFLCLPVLVISQQVQPVKIGDQVPDLKLGEILNYPALSSARISDFKGKLLILDFWFTGCVTCIQQFPKLEMLQKKFGNQIVILPVGFDATAPGSIRKFINGRKGTIRELKLPTAIQAVEDSILLKYFPCNGMPHEVWISSDGRLIGTTDHTAVMAGNIQEILKGNAPSFNSMIKKVNVYDLNSFVKKEKSKTSPEFQIFQSIFLGYIDSIKNNFAFGVQRDSTIRKLFDVNQTIYVYYKRAWGNEFPDLLNDNNNRRIIVESSNKNFYKDWADVKNADNWNFAKFQRNNLFSYQLILPNKFSLDDAYRMMRQDLDRYLHIESFIENRITTHYLLITKDHSGKINAKGTEGSSSTEDYLTVKMRNTRMSALLSHLEYLTSLPVIDSTNIKENIDIDMSFEAMPTIDELRKALQKFDLDLIEVTKSIPMLILRDKR